MQKTTVGIACWGPVFVLVCCSEPSDTLCVEVECSGNGTCVVVDGEPTCECDQGYEPGPDLACLPEAVDGDTTDVGPDSEPDAVDEPDAPIDEPDAPIDEPDAPIDEPDAPIDEPDAPIDAESDAEADMEAEADQEGINCDIDEDGFEGEQCDGPDCADEDPLVNPDAVEICNEIDDNCDGVVDIPIGPEGEPLRITNDPAHSRYPQLAWSGQEYAVAWTDERDENQEIYFARITEELEVTELRVTDDENTSMGPRLIWTGTEYALAWTDGRSGWFDVYFNRLSPEGEIEGEDIRVTTALSVSYLSSLAHSTTEFAVSWHDYRLGAYLEVYFALLDGTGEKTTEDILVTVNDSHTSSGAQVIWNGTEYGLAWNDEAEGSKEIYFGRISEEAEVQDGQLRVSEAGSTSYAPTLVRTETEYAVAWQDTRDGVSEIYFARLSSAGELIGDEVRVTETEAASANPKLVWTGEEFGIAWQEGAMGSERIYFARLSWDGIPIGDIVPLINSTGTATSPSLVHDGERYAVAWTDDRDENTEIYFALIGGCY